MKERLPYPELKEEFEKIMEKCRKEPTLEEKLWMKRNRIIESEYPQGDVFDAICQFLGINDTSIADKISHFAYLLANRWYPKTLFAIVDEVKELCRKHNLNLERVIVIFDYFKLRWKEN